MARCETHQRAETRLDKDTGLNMAFFDAQRFLQTALQKFARDAGLGLLMVRCEKKPYFAGFLPLAVARAIAHGVANWKPVALDLRARQNGPKGLTRRRPRPHHTNRHPLTSCRRACHLR